MDVYAKRVLLCLVFILNVHAKFTDKEIINLLMTMQRLFLKSFMVATALFWLAGCNKPSFINLTSGNLNQNPSGIYTMQTEIDLQDRNIVEGSLQVFAIIGGQEVPMVTDQLNNRIWSCDYKLPAGYDEAAYYFRADYEVNKSGSTRKKEKKSKLQRFSLENRYVGNLAAYRAPVGSEIAVQGRGFTRHDNVRFGGQATQTKYLSENEIRFVVPALPAGVDYPVQLIGGPYGSLDVGDFRIDESSLSVSPQRIEISSGESDILLFKIDFEAPAGGLPVQVETDVPASVIMPEARIQEGARTANIPIKGGQAGTGNLFIKVPGLKEVTIPIKVL